MYETLASAEWVIGSQGRNRAGRWAPCHPSRGLIVTHAPGFSILKPSQIDMPEGDTILVWPDENITRVRSLLNISGAKRSRGILFSNLRRLCSRCRETACRSSMTSPRELSFSNDRERFDRKWFESLELLIRKYYFSFSLSCHSPRALEAS